MAACPARSRKATRTGSARSSAPSSTNRAAIAIPARKMIENLPDSPELVAGLRHLLEAKDCFVRAAIAASET